MLTANAQNGWERLEDMPTAKFLHSSCVLNSKIYITGGGVNNGSNLATLEVYDIENNNWEVLSNMGYARRGHISEAIDDKIYTVGGISNDEAINIIEEYDPIEDTWTNKGELAENRFWHSSSVLNNKIYITGGVKGTESTFTTLKGSNIYDPISNNWEAISDMNFARAFHASCVYNDKLFVFGGIGEDFDKPALTSAEMYNPSTNQWTEIENIPVPIFTQVAIANEADGYILLFGGDETLLGDGYKSVYKYLPSTGRWIKMEDMPFIRCDMTGHNINSHFYLCGGSIDSELNVTNEVWRINLNSLGYYNGWEMVNDEMPTPRSVHGSSILNNEIYVIGGGNDNQTSGFLASTEIYNIEQNTWRVVQNMNQKRIAHTVEAYNNKIYAIGGLEDNVDDPTNVEEYDPIQDSWVLKNDMPQYTRGHTSCKVDDKIYVMGGIVGPNTAIPNCYYYYPIADKWIPIASMNSPRAFATSCVYNEKIYVFGGDSGEEVVNTVEVYDPTQDRWSNLAPMPEKIMFAYSFAYGDSMIIIGGTGDFFSDSYNTIFRYEPSNNKWKRLRDLPFNLAAMSGNVYGNYLYLIGGQFDGDAQNVSSEIWRIIIDSLHTTHVKHHFLKTESNNFACKNYPNPFYESTTLSYELNKPERVRIEIYNMLGQQVTSLHDGFQIAGKHEIEWNASNVNPGIYFARFRLGKAEQTIKMLVSP